MHTHNARRTDPVTSHLAGEAIERTGTASHQRNIVLSAVKKCQGLTSKELAWLFNLDRHMVARRLPEIQEIEKGGTVICSVGGSKCVTWKLRETLQ